MTPLDLDKLAAAKLWLVSDGPTRGRAEPGDPRGMPYLAHALYALVPVATPEVDTMTCDELWRVYVNPDWLVTATTPEVAGLLAHLVWHLLLDHANRARDLDVDRATADAWGKAADATVVDTLLPDRVPCAPARSSADLGLPGGRSAEEHFASLSALPVGPGAHDPDHQPEELLPDDAGCGSGCDGVRRGHELPPDADIGEIRPEDAREIRRRVAIDYTAHTGRGDRPGDAQRWARQILEPRIAWEPLLAAAVRRAVGWTNGRTDYTHTRPSRRQSSMPRIVLPGVRRPIPNVAMVVDTSGSVDDHLLGRALGEVDGALRALGVGSAAVTVLSCDAAVHSVKRLRRARDARLDGGGGTDLRVGIATAAQQRPRADLIVVFTDGETPWPHEAPPGSVVIAALLGRYRSELPPTPAWALRIECLLD